jgi:hypothetical protein
MGESSKSLMGVHHFKGVVPVAEMRGEDDAETSQLKTMLDDAVAYLRSFAWCLEIKETYFGFGFGEIVAIFLFRIEPAKRDVDEWLWVVIGDLPPAYLVTDNAKNPAAALDCYVGEMERWVDAVKAGKPVDHLIPVNVPPTLKWAELLQARLAFFEEHVLSAYADDLKDG